MERYKVWSVLVESDGCEEAGDWVEDSDVLLTVEDHDDNEEERLVEETTVLLLTERVVEPCSLRDELGVGEEPERLVEVPTLLLVEAVTE